MEIETVSVETVPTHKCNRECRLRRREKQKRAEKTVVVSSRIRTQTSHVGEGRVRSLRHGSFADAARAAAAVEGLDEHVVREDPGGRPLFRVALEATLEEVLNPEGSVRGQNVRGEGLSGDLENGSDPLVFVPRGVPGQHLHHRATEAPE